MLKLLKIGSYVSVVLAVVVVAIVGLRGFKRDEGASNLLDSPGAFEKYKAKTDQFNKAGDELDSPLVKQAKAFALRINPPAAVKADVPKVQRSGGLPPRPAARKPLYTKFSLIGTCVNRECPEKSLALIDIPGKGREWVFEGGEVNRVVIEKVSEGKIVYRDGAAKNELFVPAVEGKSLLKVANNTKKAGPSSVQIADAIKERLSKTQSRPSSAVIRPKTQITPKKKAENASAVLKIFQEKTMNIDEKEQDRLKDFGTELLKIMTNKDKEDKK